MPANWIGFELTNLKFLTQSKDGQESLKSVLGFSDKILVAYDPNPICTLVEFLHFSVRCRERAALFDMKNGSSRLPQVIN